MATEEKEVQERALELRRVERRVTGPVHGGWYLPGGPEAWSGPGTWHLIPRV
jgi:hypothetical protein